MGGGGGGGRFRGTKGASAPDRYTGKLIEVKKEDAAADWLAEKIGGEPRVRYENDPNGREFDVISDKYIAQSKPAVKVLGKKLRKQMKETFMAAKETGKQVYYHFNGEPGKAVIAKLLEYSKKYGIKVIIDTTHIPTK